MSDLAGIHLESWFINSALLPSSGIKILDHSPNYDTGSQPTQHNLNYLLHSLGFNHI